MLTLLKMSGKTQKGKNRIREHGDRWELHREADRVIFDSSPGPWGFVSPEGLGRDANGSRWVNLRSDKDFEIEVLNA